ncbi:MAG: dihydroxy-acid dehydratase, partial [Variovorax sp.]
MTAPKERPKRFRSSIVDEGVIRATTRSFLHALGLDDDEIRRPRVAVIHTGGDMSPCNTALRDQALHAKTG